MRELRFLNKKEKNNIKELLNKQYECSIEIKYEMVINQKNKLYFISKEVATIDLSKIRINTIGLYIGEIQHNNIRLSIEGSQLIGPTANKNILQLSKKQQEQWLKGEDMVIEDKKDEFYIITHNNDFIGCGKIKNSMLLNYIPKTRRMRTIH